MITRRTNKICIGIGVFVLVVLSLFLSIGYVAVIFRRTNEGGSVEKFETSKIYKIWRINEITNQVSRGYTTRNDELGEDDFLYYQDETTNDHVLISNFGAQRYECRGLCSCEDESDRRTTFPIIRKMKYLLTAASSFIAYDLAKKYFKEKCDREMEDVCVHSVSITDDCLSDPDLKSYNEWGSGKITKWFQCSGNCLEGDQFVWKGQTIKIPDRRSLKGSGSSDFTFNGEEVYFAVDRGSWRNWLDENHSTKNSIWLMKYKVHTNEDCVHYDDSVEEALCYGWIDSIVRRVDDDKYVQKFTPRRKGSNWSKLNLERAGQLIKKGLMTESGKLELEKWLEKNPEDREIVWEDESSQMLYEMDGEILKGKNEEEKEKIEEDDVHEMWKGPKCTRYSLTKQIRMFSSELKMADPEEEAARLLFVSLDLHYFCEGQQNLACVGYLEDYENPTSECIHIEDYKEEETSS